MRRRLTGQLGLLTPLVLATSVASADDAELLPVRLSVAGQNAAAATFDVTAALTTDFRERLQSGLTSRVQIELRLIDPNERPIARTSRTCTFQFDIWDELLEVRIKDGPAQHRPALERYIDRGLERCGRVDGIKLANLALLSQRSGYQVEVLVQLNPISEEQIQRARAFMSNPRSSRRSRARNIFGAVADMFGSRPNYLDDEFLFRSQLLNRPSRRRRQ